MVIIPGATAYLLADRFTKVLLISFLIGSISSFLGAYLSFYIDGATGGIIVLLQAFIFIIVFLFATKHGYLNLKNISKTFKEIND